jgi:hypothetical protein
LGQFKDLPKDTAERSQKTVAGLNHINVRVKSGTFQSGMPGQPAEEKDGWALNATIVETPEGPYFFKMTGPAETVTEQEANFDALLSSVKIN